MFDRKVQLPFPPNRPKQLDAHTLPYIDANIILKCFFGKVGKINTSEKRRQSVKLRVYSHCSADLLSSDVQNSIFKIVFYFENTK